MPKLQQRSNQSYFLILPKGLVEAKGWKKGDEIEVLLNNGDIILRRVNKNGETPRS